MNRSQCKSSQWWRDKRLFLIFWYFCIRRELFMACIVCVCVSLCWKTDGASAEMCLSWIMVKAFRPCWGHRWILTCNSDNAWNKHLRSNALCILWWGRSCEVYAVATFVCISYASPLSSKTNVILTWQSALIHIIIKIPSELIKEGTRGLTGLLYYISSDKHTIRTMQEGQRDN